MEDMLAVVAMMFAAACHHHLHGPHLRSAVAEAQAQARLYAPWGLRVAGWCVWPAAHLGDQPAVSPLLGYVQLVAKPPPWDGGPAVLQELQSGQEHL